jgi:hypothetical protein
MPTRLRCQERRRVLIGVPAHGVRLTGYVRCTAGYRKTGLHPLRAISPDGASSDWVDEIVGKITLRIGRLRSHEPALNEIAGRLQEAEVTEGSEIAQIVGKNREASRK